MDEYIIPFGVVRQTDARRVGTKAAVLGTLLEAGFPVPLGLCVTTAASRLALDPWSGRVDAIIHKHGLHDPAGAADVAHIIDELLDDLGVPALVMMALRQASLAVTDPETPLAVRSSATAEDSSAASFAGQYHSVIGVRGEAALQAAIVAVWRSFFSSNALAARAARSRLDGKVAEVQKLQEQYGLADRPGSHAGDARQSD